MSILRGLSGCVWVGLGCPYTLGSLGLFLFENRRASFWEWVTSNPFRSRATPPGVAEGRVVGIHDPRPRTWHPSGMRRFLSGRNRWCRRVAPQPPAIRWHPIRDARAFRDPGGIEAGSSELSRVTPGVLVVSEISTRPGSAAQEIVHTSSPALRSPLPIPKGSQPIAGRLRTSGTTPPVLCFGGRILEGSQASASDEPYGGQKFPAIMRTAAARRLELANQ